MALAYVCSPSGSRMASSAGRAYGTPCGCQVRSCRRCSRFVRGPKGRCAGQGTAIVSDGRLNMGRCCSTPLTAPMLEPFFIASCSLATWTGDPTRYEQLTIRDTESRESGITNRPKRLRILASFCRGNHWGRTCGSICKPCWGR
jgi:hypothetical protein